MAALGPRAVDLCSAVDYHSLSFVVQKETPGSCRQRKACSVPADNGGGNIPVYNIPDRVAMCTTLICILINEIK